MNVAISSKHLGQIAKQMYKWRGTIADEMELTQTDVEAITTKYRDDLTLQTYVWMYINYVLFV